MTIAHLRIYTVNKGQMDSWLKLFQEEIVPRTEEAGIEVVTCWVNAEKSQFIWIRAYGDSESDIEAKEAKFYGSDWWSANVDRVRGHLAHREIIQIETV